MVRRWLRVRIEGIVALIAAGVGIMFASLPQEWIEWRLGFDPDVGDGVAERLLVAVLLAIGVALAVSAFMGYRSLLKRHEASSHKVRRRGYA
jgi:hypothetical protein